jgi:hypothetical protein
MTRMMLVTNPQPSQDRDPDAVIVFAYMIEGPDGPSFTAWPFLDSATALDYLRVHWGIQESDWQVVPDQLPGCQDDWIEPVRIYCAEDGGKVFHRWQRLVEGAWVEFEGPEGGYGLQLV